jgi:hypothetical protein
MLFNHVGLHVIWLPWLGEHLDIVGSYGSNSILTPYFAKYSTELAFKREPHIAHTTGISSSHAKPLSLQPPLIKLTWFGILVLLNLL